VHSHNWFFFFKAHKLVCSLSRREIRMTRLSQKLLIRLLKREWINRRGYKDRKTARKNIFNYIEMFYNPIRWHGHNVNLLLIKFKKSLLLILRVSNKLLAIQLDVSSCSNESLFKHKFDEIISFVGSKTIVKLIYVLIRY